MQRPEQYGPVATVSKGPQSKAACWSRDQRKVRERENAGVRGSRGFSNHSKDLAFTMSEMEATEVSHDLTKYSCILLYFSYNVISNTEFNAV